MKPTKLICIIFGALLMLMPMAFAANAYNLEEFTKEAPMQAIVLEEGDMVDFSLMEGTHRMRIKEISRSNTTIKLNVYPFSNEASEAQQVPFFGLDNIVRVDLNADDEDDVILDILEINDRRVTLAVASIAHMDEAKQEGIEGEVIEEAPQGQGVVHGEAPKNYSKTYAVIIIAIVLLAGAIYYRAINAEKKKKAPEEKAEEQ